MSEEPDYFEKEDAPYAGKYELTVKEGDGEAQTTPIKVIGMTDVYEKDQRKLGSPIIAYRNGVHGSCSVFLNLDAFSSIEQVIEYRTKDEYYVMPGKTTPKVLSKSEYKDKISLFADHLDNSPRLLLQATTTSGLPFYASITYIPTSFRHPHLWRTV